MDYVPPPPSSKGGDAIHQCPLDAVAVCFLLTCAPLMTRAHLGNIPLLTHARTHARTRTSLALTLNSDWQYWKMMALRSLLPSHAPHFLWQTQRSK